MSTENDKQPNPLIEADNESIEELFSRFDSHVMARTLNLPDARESVDKIVTVLRQQRVTWEAAETTGAKRAPRARKTQDTTLKDLDLA